MNATTVRVNTQTRQGRRRNSRRSQGGAGGNRKPTSKPGKKSPKRKPNPSNWYLDSILNPDRPDAVVKVPDATGVPTGTFQLSYDTFANFSGPGTFGIGFSPSATGTIFHGTGQSGQYAQHTFAGWNSATSIYTYTRCVSASIEATYVGSTNSDQGVVCGAWAKPRYTDQNQAWAAELPTSMDYAMSAQGNSIAPLRNGLKVVWRPADNQDVEFQDASTPEADRHSPVIWIFVSGAATASNSVRIRVVANFEGIPALDTASFVQASPSVINTDMFTKTLNVLQNIKSAMPVIRGVVGLANYAYIQSRTMQNRQQQPRLQWM